MDAEKVFMEGQLLEGSADPEKREVIIDLIREGFGNKRDNHYYSRDVLEAAAASFKDAKQYVDHLDPATAKKLNGMPRSVRDIAGRILEAWIDTNSNGETVVRGRAKVAQPWLWELVENDPGLLGVSINAWGKSKEGTVDGKTARIVEGISRVGSVDWVTEAGAGGKVVSLVEAQLEQEADEVAGTDISSLTLEQLREERPDLIDDALLSTLAESEDENDDDEADSGSDVDETRDEGADESDLDGDLDSDEEEIDDEADVSEHDADLCPTCGGLFTEAEAEQVAQALAEEKLQEAVAAAVEVVRERFEEELVEQEAKFDRELTKRDQRVSAAKLIERAGFKRPTEKVLKESFADVVFDAEKDDEGNEVKSADQVLSEAVQAAIDEKRQELAEYTEARVTGAGESSGGSLQEGGGSRPKSAPINDEIDAQLGIE